jgi:peptidoglycan/LPS O-acetylase OafA/YrhL
MDTAQTHSATQHYRPDIDGLRAIAVLLVIGYHAFPQAVGGGFVGVDVFFVISGFLITGILVQQLQSGGFSIGGFYARRVRRIFPAVLCVLLGTAAIGWFVLLADEYKQLGKHVSASAAFASNLALAGEAGYFDNAAETKPLLHLWSLGIEEQFYILWPLALWAAWKLRLNLISVALLACVVSFGLAASRAEHDAVTTFFAPQTRGWELLVGCLLACGTSQWRDRVDAAHAPDWASNLQSLLGAALIGAAAFSARAGASLPLWWAAASTAGAALIIGAGPGAWLNRVALSNRLLVGIGLISFSLYLWHWPLLAFARIVEGETPSELVRTSAVLLAIALAIASWRYVETPFRSPVANAKREFALAAAMLIVGCAGLLIYLKDGLADRAVAQAASSNAAQLEWNSFRSSGCRDRLGMDSQFCIVFGDPSQVTLAVLGDSTANSLAPGLGNVYAAAGRGVINLGHWSCPPIRGLVPTATWSARGGNCPQINDKAYHLVLADPKIDAVVLGFLARDLGVWGTPGATSKSSLDDKFKAVIPLLEADIRALQQRGKKVIVTFDAAQSPLESRDCLRLAGKIKAKCDVRQEDLVWREPALSLFARHFKNLPGVCVFEQGSVLLTDRKLNIFDAGGTLLMRDSIHLSYHGSDQMARALLAQCGPAALQTAPSRPPRSARDDKVRAMDHLRLGDITQQPFDLARRLAA